MRILTLLFLALAACVSPAPLGSPLRGPASVVIADPSAAPPGSFFLSQALTLAHDEVWTYLFAKSEVEAFPCVYRDNVLSCLPPAFRTQMRVSLAKPSEVNRQVQVFLRTYRSKSTEKRQERAEKLLEKSSCEQGPEIYALALMMEVDFPTRTAFDAAVGLHKKIESCESSFQRESLIRQAVLLMSIEKFEPAKTLLAKAETLDPKAPKDRIRYLEKKCDKTLPVVNLEALRTAPLAVTSPTPVAAGVPWNAYFIGNQALGAFVANESRWYLSPRSGFENWDRYLMTLVKAQRSGNTTLFRSLVKDLNVDSLRDLPRPFQASVLTLLHFAGEDLQVFRLLHPLLSAEPRLASHEILQVLFPKRHWETIMEVSDKADPLLVNSVIRQESAFNPQAHSRAGAMGLMQLIFPTARRFGVRSRQALLGPEVNVRAGSRYLAGLIEEFGTVEMALAAYNAGPDHVREWKKRYMTADPDLFVELIPYRETREYVRLVLRNYRVYKSLLSEAPPGPSLAEAVNH